MDIFVTLSIFAVPPQYVEFQKNRTNLVDETFYDAIKLYKHLTDRKEEKLVEIKGCN